MGARRRLAPTANAVHQRRGTDGELWQPRFFDCALRSVKEYNERVEYVHLNPVRAGLVMGAADWPCSSAAAHGGRAKPQAWLEMPTWRQHGCGASGQEFLAAGEVESELRAIQRCTRTGRPLATREFVEKLERHRQRRLAPQKGGRKPNSKTRQEEGTLHNKKHAHPGFSET